MSESTLAKSTTKKQNQHPVYVLDSISQLNKLTLTQIKQLPITSLQGLLVDLAKQEALRIEMENQPTPIKQICFSINVKIDFKQSIVLIANIHSWNLDNAIYLNWAEGHFWSCHIPSEALSGDIEYKYAIAEGKNLKWEEGTNRIFSKQKLEKELASPIYCYRVAKKQKVHLKQGGKEYVYDPTTYTLSFLEVWQF